MKRFLVVYTCYDSKNQCCAEGLIHFDGTVYVRGFYQETGKLFIGLNEVSYHFRDNPDIAHFSILMIDVVQKGEVIKVHE